MTRHYHHLSDEAAQSAMAALPMNGKHTGPTDADKLDARRTKETFSAWQM
jgi:hypothetical protein|tara:strand:- start:154 stop:303 length:150 start_codon:yes stop_codon:yes gene_type:complete